MSEKTSATSQKKERIPKPARIERSAGSGKWQEELFRLAEVLQRSPLDLNNLKPEQILNLQGSIGNQAVIEKIHRSISPLSRNDFSLLQRVFTASDPKTYDNDGGHGYSDHGPDTTEAIHKIRLKTGATPSRPDLKEIPEKSSKFSSLEIMISAVSKAAADSKKTAFAYGKKKSKKRITLAYNISGAGISYKLDPKDPEKVISSPVNWVVVVLEQTGAGQWDLQYDKIITLFPSDSSPKQYDNQGVS